MRIDKSRYYVIDDEIHGGFYDYVAIIKPSISENLENYILNWSVVFSKGDGYNQQSKPIFCSSLEEAFELVEEYSNQVKFDNLLEELSKTHKI